MEALEFETLSFQALAGGHQHIVDAVIQDKSNSGMGCLCAPRPMLRSGLQLILWDLVIYEVRYVQIWSAQVMKLGLKLIDEI
jgi:hypothetical protein